MTARVREALEGLSEPHRRVIQLRRFEERPFHEIAPAMERSENAARILYFRALRALKEELKRTGTLSAWGSRWNRF
jgi:RNA polymerase sigma factor (sigma-70 family)